MTLSEKVVVVLFAIGNALMVISVWTNDVPRSIWGLAFVIYSGACEIANAIKEKK